MVSVTVELRLRFRDGLVWTVSVTVELKLRFRDGLVWTVGLTEEYGWKSSCVLNFSGFAWTQPEVNLLQENERPLELIFI